MIFFDNHKENVLWFWSIVAAGGVPAVLNPLSNDPKTREGQLDNVKRIFTDLIIVTSQRLAQDLTTVERSKILAIEDISRTYLYHDEISTDRISTCSDDLAAILFTSGSTGRAKAVEYTHAQLIASVTTKSAFHKTNSRTNFLSWVCGYEPSLMRFSV